MRHIGNIRAGGCVYSYVTRRTEDEQLEIVFWWMGGDSSHPIENGLDDYLEQTKLVRRRRRLPWPDRLHRSTRTAS